MLCPSCQHENRDGAKFCEECASPLKRTCSGCGAELRPTAKFCDECGSPVTARPEKGDRYNFPEGTPVSDDGTRKVVTIIFADLAGSTALHERLDAESARLFMEGYYRAMRGAVERHGGKVAKLLGDGVMAVFGLPLVAEDDAIRAVRAAVDMQRVFRELAEWHSNLVGKVGLRVAVNTGEVVAKDETELIGDPVNVAARLQDQARDGDVVIGESTRRLVSALITLEHLGSLALKGRAEAVSAYRVVSLERPASATTAAFVGRDDELARLMAVHETATRTPAARLTVLLGSPGLGKSRLIGEFVRRAGDNASVIAGHCDLASGTSFAPVTQALRRFLGIDDGATAEAIRATVDAAVSGNDADRARIVDGITALLGGSPASPEETFFVVRRLLAALATTKPVVLVIDDLHWAEPLLLDLVEHLVQWGGGVPLFVLVGARPELRDTRSSLTTSGGVVADVVTLAGLDAGAAMRLAANMLGAADLPAAIAAKVLASSEGNPLFVGELVRMLVHEGALKREGDRWTVGVALAALEMPPTIHALLAARIERLRPEDRAVLERAAVVGRHFSRSAVSALLPRDVNDIDARLESLRRSELIESDTGWFLGEPVLRFHHLLIRDAAYRRLLKGTRAELHGKLADWIEAKTGDAVEHDETLGWHLEQAYLHLRELGPLDERGRATGEKAARHLAAAGRRSLARDDLSLAAGLLGRALPCLDAADASRAELALDWCEALLAAGDVTDAAAAIAELGRFIADSPRLRAWHTCFTGQLTALTAPQALHETADAVAAAAEELAALGDDAGEAKAHAVHAQALARLGRVGACEAALDRALASARKAGDRRRANAVLAGAPVAALWGPSPVTRASGRCLDVVRVLRITQGAPAVEAVALSCQGVLEALRGRTDAAKRMIALSRKMVEELGISHRLYEADVFAGRIDLLEGDAEAAERRLRGAYDGLRDLGLGIDAARAAALLARALLALGRAEEAEALSHESEILAGDDLQAAIAWRGVRAEALAKRGDHGAAVELAQASVAIAAATDALLDHADARLALAAALRASGRAAEADAEEKRAIELWEAKGATLLAERARSSAATATVSAAEPDARADQIFRTTDRRVHDNAATRNVLAFSAAIKTLNAAAAANLLADDFVVVHHPTGSTYDKAGMIGDFELGNAVGGFAAESVPLAGLGETMGLFRAIVRGDSYERDDGASFGAFELNVFFVVEVNGESQRRRLEVFAADHLDHAIVCLYERHAAQLPEGPARVRTETIARSIRSRLGETKDWSGFAPDLVSHDHRHTGAGELVGAAALIESFAAIQDLATDLVYRIDDIVHLDENALSAIGTNFGTDKLSGGVFERVVCMVWMFREDGLLHRWDTFEPEDIAAVHAHLEALLPAKPAPQLPARPRVRLNEATRNVARFASTFSANDIDASADLYADDVVNVHHVTGISFGKDSMVESWRTFGVAANPSCESEALASFGDTLCLARQVVRIEGVTRDDAVSMGPIEHEMFLVVEVNEQGRRRRNELFAMDHLGDAIARLYEIRAETLPEGDERERAAATARAVQLTLQETHDLTRFATVLAPDLAYEDHRRTGAGRLVGAAAALENLQAFEQLSSEMVWRYEEILHLDEFSLAVHGINTGKDIRSGGDFERRFALFWTFGSDGLLTRMEVFEPEDAALALARLDELAPHEAIPVPTPRRVRTNAACEMTTRVVTAFAASDQAALAACFSDSLVVVDHPNGATYGRDGQLDSLKRLRRSRDPSLHVVTVATLGERLQLASRRVSSSGTSGGNFDVGPYERQEFMIAESNDGEQTSRTEIFGADCLGEALHRFYELHAEFLVPGPERERAEAVARSIAGLLARRVEVERWAAGLAPSIQFADRRNLGLPAGRGADRLSRSWDTLFRMLDDLTTTVERVLCVETQGLLVETRNRARDRTSGGAVEFAALILLGFDSDGLIAHYESFESDRDADALTRFDELMGSAAQGLQNLDEIASPAEILPPSPYDNLASREWRGLLVRWLTAVPRWEQSRLADDFRYSDRRRMSQLEVGLDEFTRFTTELQSMPSRRLSARLLATRGERLCLVSIHLEVAGDDVGPSEIEHLNVVELNTDGAVIALVRLDLDDVDAAYAELESRFRVGEAAEHPRAAATLSRYGIARDTRQWEALAAQFHPDLVTTDHRVLGWGTLQGRDEFLKTQKTLVDLAPDTRHRVQHVRNSEHGYLAGLVISGTRDGGSFELPSNTVMEIDEQGFICRVDIYDSEDHERAFARFRSIDGPAESEPLAAFQKTNAATQTRIRYRAAAEAGDWDALRAMLRNDAVFEDRRGHAQISGGVDLWIDNERLVSAGPFENARVHNRVIGLAGQRIAIENLLWTAGPADGLVEVEVLEVNEVDEEGLFTRSVVFNPDQRREAQREALSRWIAIDPNAPAGVSILPNICEAFDRHDAGALRGIFEADFVLEDHRLVGLGRIDDVNAYADSLTALWELAPDTTLDGAWYWLAYDSHGWVTHLTRSGNLPDGGAFESPYLLVSTTDSHGKLHGGDLFEMDAVDAALACYRRRLGDSLHKAPDATHGTVANTAPGLHEPTLDHLRLPPNAATRLHAKLVKIHALRDWEGVRRLAGDDFHFEDRGKRALVDGDVETWLKSMQFVASHPGVRFEHELLGTLGDRILVGKLSWIGESHEAEFLTDKLRLVEVAADGELRRVILFDLDDRAAAFAEALGRFVAGEAGGADGLAAYTAFVRKLSRYDWEAMRETLSPDLVFDDRRPLSLGVLDREQWIASLRVQADMAPDLASEVSRVFAWNRHGFVASLRTYGSLRDGGPFENVFLCVFLASGGKLTRVEPYPIDAHEEVVARLGELCDGLDGGVLRVSTTIPPNSAAKAGVRFFEVLGSEGDDRAAALVSPDFHYRDRGRRALLEGDIRIWIRSIRFMASQSRSRSELFAAIGDRIAIHRIIWTGRPDGPELEIDRISLLEVDDAGRLCRVTLFDLQDRIEAMQEALERFAAGEAGGGDGPTTYTAFTRAVRQRDWDAASDRLSPSMRLVDHRPLSLGVLDGRQWLESLRVHVDLAPDYASDVSRVLAWNSRGFLASMRGYGTLRDGGPFENVMLTIWIASDGKLTHVEPFPIDAEEAAVARFEELTRGPLDIAPNAASRVGLQTMELFLACNWPAVRELVGPGFCYEDRSRRALVTGDVETWITSMQFVREQLPARTEHKLIATFGDRVELREFMFVANPDGAVIEIERLRLAEVDEQGRLVAVVFFDPEDRAAACVEGLRRFATREVAEAMPVVAFFEAFCRHDWEAIRQVLSSDCMLDDHRPLSFGIIDREQWIASLAVQVEMAPGFATEPLRVIVWNRHGLVLQSHTYGNLRDGGPFENPVLTIFMTARERIVRVEPFPTGEVDKALARFDELCATREADAADIAHDAPVTTA